MRAPFPSRAQNELLEGALLPSALPLSGRVSVTLPNLEVGVPAMSLPEVSSTSTDLGSRGPGWTQVQRLELCGFGELLVVLPFQHGVDHLLDVGL